MQAYLLFCLSWPSVSNIEQKTVAFLETTLKDAYRDRNIVLASHANMDYVPNPQDDEENMSEYKKTVLKQEEIKGKLFHFSTKLRIPQY